MTQPSRYIASRTAPNGPWRTPSACGQAGLRPALAPHTWRTPPACGWAGLRPALASRGFTLVELLAVILIIAMLAALVTPAVMRSLSAARAAAVKTDIDMLHMALMNYKNEYGAFPPALMFGLWNSTASPPQVNQAHPVFRHLKRLFPRLNEATTDSAATESPYKFMAQMSPAQAMVFWLDGFFDNPQFPLTNGSAISTANPRAAGTRQKMFDFDQSRLYAASQYFGFTATAPTRQTFDSRNSSSASAFAKSYPVYFPSQSSGGLPFVYFPSSTYSTAFNDLSYLATSLAGDPSDCFPYFTSQFPPNPTWSQCHPNADGFQLIAAGIDGNYGDVQCAFPGAVAANGFGITHPAVPGAISVPKHADNITNFAAGPLREAAEKLLSQ